VLPSPATAGCALTQVDLPATLPPCAPPDAKEYATEADLEVSVDRFPDTLRSGAAVELAVTMKNVSKVPLRLLLSESQTLTFEVSKEGDPDDGPTETVEPPPQPAVQAMPACAHVSCEGPLMQGPPRPPPPSITLAPGGLARARATWRPRRWVVPPPKVNGCCDIVRFPPVAVGPLAPGMYIVQMRVPLWQAYDGNPGVPRARADIEVVP